MLLSELINVVDYNEVINRTGIDTEKTVVSAICCDSRKACEGALFVCIPGSIADGHDYARSAYNGGCRIFVTEHRTTLPDDAFIIITGDTRVALARLSAVFFGYPADEMTIIGITGTKGKTTSSLLIYNILNESGIPTGYIGSNGVNYLDYQFTTVNTTPESYDLHAHMRRMVDSGVKTLVMEVSSQALKMARVHGIKFDICVFTNHNVIVEEV
jgi:UDP-N-acetylmuramoyl-L-alanyl-D-glutamate--2,6-diaminopimelate ligase